MSHLSEEQLDKLVDAERARDHEPLNDWHTIAARAKEEGIILSTDSRWWPSARPWLEAAAAVLLLVGGIAIGRTTTGLPGDTAGAVASASPDQQSAAVPAREEPKVPEAQTFASADEATETLRRALVEYQHASEYLAAANSTGSTTTDSSRLYQNRLAALTEVRGAMERAIHTAPDDPVINQYYLATMGAQVATKQMAARPVSLALKGF